MKLTRIDTGAVEEVAVPDPIVLTRAEGSVLKKWEVASTDTEYNNALQSWVYRNGYEVPEVFVTEGLNPRLRALLEATTNVRAQVRKSKKTGKAWNVRAHERKITSDPKTWSKGLSESETASLLQHADDPEANLYLRGQLRLDDVFMDDELNADVEMEPDWISKLYDDGEYDKYEKALNKWRKDKKKEPKQQVKREKKTARQNAKEYIASIDSAIDKFEIPKDTLVYRGMAFERKPAWLKSGAVIQDKAWVSTSTKQSVAKEMIDEYSQDHSVMVMVKIPKGTKAAPVYALKGNEYRYQQELLLKRGSKFRVKKVTSKERTSAGEYLGTMHVVEAEYVK